jgi:hypothetical protein
MELIKRKIHLEDGISRQSDTTYGTMTASTFVTNIFLTQTYDNMGLYTDAPYYNEVPDYSILINKMNASGFTFPFMSGITPASVVLTGFTGCTRIDNADVSEWYKDGDVITAETTTRLNELRSYNNSLKYISGFNIEQGNYLNYDNVLINGVSQVVDYNLSGTTTYTFDGNDDADLGTPDQNTGLLFFERPDQRKTSRSGNDFEIKKLSTAFVQFKAEGWNNTNTSLSALTKEEYLMGILYPPEVFSDVFIDRGNTTVMEKHMKLSEVEGVEHLTKFGNGFYNIVKT